MCSFRAAPDFTEEALLEAKRTLDRIYGALDRVAPDDAEPHPEVLQALADDLNTPRAIAALHDLLGEANRSGTREAAGVLRASAQLLGLGHQSPVQWLRGDGDVVSSITARIAERLQARKAREFARADAIRADLLAQGVILEDRPDGTTDWRRA